MVGVSAMRAVVAGSLASIWRRVQLVDTDADWYKIEGWTPWEKAWQRPKYLPPPVDYGPSLAAGTICALDWQHMGRSACPSPSLSLYLPADETARRYPCATRDIALLHSPPGTSHDFFSRVEPRLAGNMSPLSVASSPRRRGRAVRKEFHNTDTVVIDPFSKVQPRLNLRAIAVTFGESRVCETLSCLTILAHFVVQASWHTSMTAGFAEFLVTSEAVVQGIFMLEICIKIYAAGGFSNFASSIWRLLELTVVAMSFSAFAADICKCPGPTNLFIVAIKSLVHLRLVRLLVMETGMHHLFNRFVKGGSAGSPPNFAYATPSVPDRAFGIACIHM